MQKKINAADLATEHGAKDEMRQIKQIKESVASDFYENLLISQMNSFFVPFPGETFITCGFFKIDISNNTKY